MTAAHSAPVTDPWQRIGRTAIQVGLAAASLAPAYPLIRAAVEEPLANVAAVGWLGTVAAIAAGLMSIPRVNALLAHLRLDAPTAADAPALDSETRAWSLAELRGAAD